VVDHKFAEAVFAQLDRASVIYFPYEFNEGDVLTDAIAASIAESGIFVLLGSKDALKSKWVQLETQVAQSLREGGLLNDALLFTLGDASHNDFPLWLKALNIRAAINPTHVAESIHEKQLELIDRIQNPAFLNRHKELAEAEAYLTGQKAEPMTARKTVAFHGQAGFGRRSLARKAFENICGLKKAFHLRLQSADDFHDVVIKLAQIGARYSSLEELQIAIDEIGACSDEELQARATTYLSQLVSANMLLLIEDSHGLLDDDGFMLPASLALVNAVERVPGCYAAIINRRRPRATAPLLPPGIAVGDLPPDIAKALLVRYAELADVRLRSDDEAAALVQHVGRHPGALRYAISLAGTYGIDAILADRSFLTEHFIERYWGEIKKDRALTDVHKGVLSALAAYESATLDILADALNTGREALAEAIRYLVDLVLITVDPSGQYRLNSALIDVVPRLFPDIAVNHDRGFNAFTAYLEHHPGIEDRLSLERSRGVALSLSNRPDKDEKVVLLASDYIKIADAAYDAEQYVRAYDYSKLALEKRRSNPQAISIFVQSAVKRRLFSEAETCVASSTDYLQPQATENLHGLIERAKGKYDLALNHFRRAYDLGRRGLAIHRELSLCYYKLGHMADAENQLRLAFGRIHGAYNGFLLDLGIRIAISQRDEARAREYLQSSYDYDKWHHAVMLDAAIELAFGDPKIALGRLTDLEKSGGLPYFAKYLRAVADLRINDLVAAQKHIQEATWTADPTDIALLQVALAWSRGKSEEALSKLSSANDTHDAARVAQLRRFIQEHADGRDADNRRELSILLINQGAQSSRK
jgi:hypothetical protein